MKLKQSGLIAVLACLIWGLPQVSAGELTLLDKYPIKNPLFVQGLELSPEQELVLGTGLEGESKLGVFNLETGELDRSQDLPNNYFGEGLTFTPNALWQMTWKEKKVLKRDPKTFEILGEYDMKLKAGACATIRSRMSSGGQTEPVPYINMIPRPLNCWARSRLLMAN